jgi:sec-independent protein translocase protein TatA
VKSTGRPGAGAPVFQGGEDKTMGSVSIWHWVVVGIIVMLLFGRGKVSELMGDVAKGIKAFKKGMSDEEVQTTASTEAVKTLNTDAANPAETDVKAQKKV